MKSASYNQRSNGGMAQVSPTIEMLYNVIISILRIELKTARSVHEGRVRLRVIGSNHLHKNSLSLELQLKSNENFKNPQTLE